MCARNYSLHSTLETIACVRTSIRSPWQNGVAARWVGSCRRDLLDHIIALNERHLKRLLADYVRYYHEDRTHMGLAKANTRRQSSFSSPGSRCFSRAAGGPAPPLRSGRVRHIFENDLGGPPILKVASLRRSHAQQRRNALNPKLASIPGTRDLRTRPFSGAPRIVARHKSRSRSWNTLAWMVSLAQ